ncbi:hypothetical protein BDF19DRAFT_453492 [Syncephalis fuscata]|nr:hypothetical protein BDF19DRAFT_453492 [Syncephalis fuscata]
MIYTSPVPDIVLPEQSICHFLFESGKSLRKDDSTVFISAESGRKMTMADIRRDCKQFAGALKQKFNAQRGEVVMVISPNDIDYSVVVIGSIAAGLVVTPANPAYILDELIHQVEDSNTKYIIADYSIAELAKEVAVNTNIPLNRIIITNAWDGNTPKTEVDGCVTVRGLLQGAKEADLIELDVDEVRNTTAVLCYSSGTTGKPKGVELTHYNIVRWWVTLPSQDIQVNFLPFFHIYGLIVQMFAPIMRDAQIIVMRRFQLPQFLELIPRYKVTSAYVAPPVCLALSKHPIVDQFDLSSLRDMVCAAAPLGSELAAATRDRLKIIIRQGYGMTEASPITHIMEANETIDGSAGKLMPNLVAKIIDGDGNALPVGGVGEILLKGPNIMKGYLNRPDATDEAIDADGYLHTGDIGRVDEKGNFYIVDRIKEFIKYKGFQVAPAELEEIIQSHEAVADAAVVPVQCPEQATELPKAYVSLKPTHVGKITQEEIIDFTAERTAHYKRLRGGVEFIDLIPRSAAGKILRRVLREKAKAMPTSTAEITATIQT